MKQPYEDCPRYESCSVSKCPLDPDIDHRNKVPGEEKCSMRKSVRLRVGGQNSQVLPLQGLTKKEYIGKKNMDALPPQFLNQRGKIGKNA